EGSGSVRLRPVSTCAKARVRSWGMVVDRRSESAAAAIRAAVSGEGQGVGFRDATVTRARELGVMGWVRNGEDGRVRVHAEGPQQALETLQVFLHQGPSAARVAAVTVERVAVEGHEQFAIRGVSAGVFVVQAHTANTRHF